MIKSMTGFGHGEVITEEYKIVVEIKSVNHRYCDLSIKLPRKFNAFESRIRNIMKEYVSRGKVDVYISYENYSDHGIKVQYHEEIAREYVEVIRKAQEKFSLEKEGLTGAALIRYPEVVTLSEDSEDVEVVFPSLEKALRESGEKFSAARESEGEHLQQDIFGKLDYIDSLVDYVEKRSPELINEYRDKIQRKVEELLGDTKLDESILATELTIFADKVCVDEETVRLRSHIHNMRDTLQKEEPIGRKLDFVAQEMNREANTILSKANDKELSECAINLKTEIEKIREQIQNIE